MQQSMINLVDHFMLVMFFYDIPNNTVSHHVFYYVHCLYFVSSTILLFKHAKTRKALCISTKYLYQKSERILELLVT